MDFLVASKGDKGKLVIYIMKLGIHSIYVVITNKCKIMNMLRKHPSSSTPQLPLEIWPQFIAFSV